MFGLRTLGKIFHTNTETFDDIASVINANLPEGYPALFWESADDSIGDWDFVTYAGYTSGTIILDLENEQVILYAWDEENFQFYPVNLNIYEAHPKMQVTVRGC